MYIKFKIEWTGLDTGVEDMLLETSSRFLFAALLKHTSTCDSFDGKLPVYKALFQVFFFKF